MPDVETVETFPTMLRRVLGDRLEQSVEAFPDMFTSDGILEYPFAPPGIETPIIGRTAIVANFERIRKFMRIDGVSGVSEIDVVDPHIIVLEFYGKGIGLLTGELYEQRYISVIHMRNRLIAKYRDFWNPLEIIRVAKGSDSLKPLTIV